MMGSLRSLWRLYLVYGRRRLEGAPSTAAFWYLPEPARVADRGAYDDYLADATPSPLYLIDYDAKLSYTLANPQGIIELNYGAPTGRRINPEAAFQYALAHHDRFRQRGRTEDRAAFLRYARFFLSERDGRGRWLYRFAWSTAPDPWYSALAQSRGVSVMLRAWYLTGEEPFRRAALDGIADFGAPLAEGGFQAIDRRTEKPYLEEYPFEPCAAINGFLAALFGLYEVGHWLDDERARAWFALYTDSALEMLPSYTTGWWSVYDFDPASPVTNVHSPRYHRMVIGYLHVLATISGRVEFARIAERWAKMDRWPARSAATALKAIKKAMHR
jgi:hypothetical protein